MSLVSGPVAAIGAAGRSTLRNGTVQPLGRKKLARDIATEHELTPKQRPAASSPAIDPDVLDRYPYEQQPLTCLHAVTRPSFLLHL